MTANASLRLGIDVGGTFTDIVAVGAGGTLRGKVPSTPANPAEGVVAACELIAERTGSDLASLLRRVSRFGLGTTVVTNVLATRTGRRLGLLTTKGFEDLIPLARGNRVSEDGWLVPPPALVERVNVVGIDERTGSAGEIVRPVDDAAVREAARLLVEEAAVDAIVVSLLWSFRNPANEQQVCRVVADACPDVTVVAASALSPVIREYDRTQFALLNAYVGGALDWLDPLAQRLRAQGLRGGLVLTHSSGGATTVQGALEVPIGLAQSGPAAGAAAATALGRRAGEGDIVTCDLGGTSLDVALIAGGQALRRTRGRLLGYWTSLSMVDVDSVGSGGGSLAWVDPLGAVRVGPRSAGADPGPACYGRGASEATVTDALVALGYIDPARFLDGRMPLDEGLARDACARLGRRAGLDPLEAAWGIREVALAAMARAVRARIAGRGLVASDLSLLAYGGCGGLFAADIAAEVGARRSVVPELASVFSAYGAATAPLHRERAQSLAIRVPSDPAVLSTAFAALGEAVVGDLVTDGIDRSLASVAFEADLRFERQGAELTVAVPTDSAGNPVIGDLEATFRDEYVRRFGQGAVALGVAVEVMTLRALGTAKDAAAPADGEAALAAPPTLSPPAGSPARPAHHRSVHTNRSGPPTEVAVHDRTALDPGAVIEGPALIDCGDTTVWVAGGQRAGVDSLGSVVMEVSL